MIDILILFFYYNRPNLILNAINSLNEIEYKNFKIAFIDDGSDDPGEFILKKKLSKEVLDKVVFYNTNTTKEEKLKFGGSIFGMYANKAILESNSSHAIMLCDDDAIVNDYFKNLNNYFLNNDVNYCYSKVYFYNPEIEKYKKNIHSNFNHAGSFYDLNQYNLPINPANKVDSSQVCWKIRCNIEKNIWFPYPKTRCLDSFFYQKMYENYGMCYPTNFYAQYKGTFSDQLGNRWSENNNEYDIKIK